MIESKGLSDMSCRILIFYQEHHILSSSKNLQTDSCVQITRVGAIIRMYTTKVVKCHMYVHEHVTTKYIVKNTPL